jgi:hypothetical protein
MSTIHVARKGTPLGKFSSKEVKNGLIGGQFFLSDSGWKSGLERWTPFREWPEFATIVQESTPAPAPVPTPVAATTPVAKVKAKTAKTKTKTKKAAASATTPTATVQTPLPVNPTPTAPVTPTAPTPPTVPTAPTPPPKPFSGESAGEEPAWERREQVGTFKAFWQTARDVLFSPSKVFSAPPEVPGVNKPSAFFAIALVPAAILFYVSFLPIKYEFINFLINFAKRFGPSPEDSAASETFSLPASAVVGFSAYELVDIIWDMFYIIVALFIVVGAYHLLLLVFRGANRPFATTFRTITYIGGSLLTFAWVPILGPVVAFVWGTILLITALSRAHQISIGKASLVVLLPFLFCACPVVLFLFAFLVGAAGSGSH